VGVARAYTNVSANDIDSSLKTSDVGEFGGPIPLGIKLFNFGAGAQADFGRISSNEIHGGNIARGITIQDGVNDNLLVLNKVSRNKNFACLDESVGTGTDGTDNTWINNQGKPSDPPGICQ
jgi:hypothetical protein